jgi:hypothetical protein
MRSCRSRPVGALLLATIVLLHPATGTAQRRDKAEAHAFFVFLQSVTAQRLARLCERGVPGYRQQFDDFYARWSAKHGPLIARGEAQFREAMTKRDQPYTDYAQLAEIDKAVLELRQSPTDTSPITLDGHRKAVCDENLAELEAGLRSP